MFCHNCGAKVEDGALFCGECGAKLNVKYEQEKRNAPENAKITPAKKANRNGVAILAMAVIIVALAAVIVILVFRSGKDDGSQADAGQETETVSESEEMQSAQAREEEPVGREEESADGEAAENSGAAKTELIRIGDRSQTTGDEMIGNDPEGGEYVLPDSDKRYLQETDLEGLGAEELKLARNELYARHGRRFQDEALQTYFDEKDWYEGIYSPEEFPEDLLDDIEKYNRDLIVEYEKKMGYR